MNLIKAILAVLLAPFKLAKSAFGGVQGGALLAYQIAENEFDDLEFNIQKMIVTVGITLIFIFTSVIVLIISAAIGDWSAWIALVVVLLQAGALGIFVSGKYTMLIMRIGFWHGAGSGAARSLKGVKLPSYTPSKGKQSKDPEPAQQIDLVEILKSLDTKKEKGVIDGVTYTLVTTLVLLANSAYSGVHTLGNIVTKVEEFGKQGKDDIINSYKMLGIGSAEVVAQIGITGAAAIGEGGHMAVRYALAFNRGIWSAFTFLMFIQAFLVAFPFYRVGQGAIPRVILFSLIVGLGVLSFGMKTSYGKKAIIACSIGIIAFSAIAASFPLKMEGDKLTSYPTDWIGTAAKKIWDHYQKPTPHSNVIVQMTQGPTGTSAQNVTFNKQDDVTVYADDPAWQNTGIWLDQGEKFLLEVTGGDLIQISRLKYGDVGPAGHKRQYMDDGIISGLKLGETIVSIGGRDAHRIQWQCVRDPGDTECSVWRGMSQASLAGELQFMIVDKNYEDNKGSLQITVHR